MNERIKELGRQAGFAFIEDGVYGQRWYSSKCGMDADEFEKFAELIVKECVKSLWTEECRISDLASEEYTRGSNKIKKHFGVEE
jgi:hypothetical protein